MNLGADVIGIDLSLKMMAKLRQKNPAAPLRKPTLRACHSQITVRRGVDHARAAPDRAVARGAARIQRVIKPGGVYIDSTQWHDPSSQLKPFAISGVNCVEAQGAQWRRPGVQFPDEIDAELKTMEATGESVELVQYTATATARERRTDCQPRHVRMRGMCPTKCLRRRSTRLTAWCQKEIGPLDKPITEERRFTLRIARFAMTRQRFSTTITLGTFTHESVPSVRSPARSTSPDDVPPSRFNAASRSRSLDANH